MKRLDFMISMQPKGARSFFASRFYFAIRLYFAVRAVDRIPARPTLDLSYSFCGSFVERDLACRRISACAFLSRSGQRNLGAEEGS